MQQGYQTQNIKNGIHTFPLQKGSEGTWNTDIVLIEVQNAFRVIILVDRLT